MLIEAPLLFLALSRVHPVSRRLFAGFWLTACTYPIVVLVMPIWLNMPEQRWLYLAVAETFAPLTECLLFLFAFHRGQGLAACDRWRDYAAIVLANLASFLLGEWLHAMNALPF
ncbi:MAG: hypothetical protein R3236_00555 [Phycisphaeraceae bacterium]|nr:hypothetical protein [Phycisphaeraceae bacterium]